jgi:enoyl-CoA hydratase
MIIEKRDGIALITLNRPEKFNATDARLHNELTRIWLDIDQDDEVRVALITGAGQAFSAGGDFTLIESQLQDPELILRTVMKEAHDLVYNMVNCSKPIVSAINGVAVGAGLAAALVADITIASERARFGDGHVRLGVAAGDHACMIWPLLCGMAKAKYYLLTGEMLDAREAERIGLVSMVVPHEELMDRAMEVARRLANGPQRAIRWTKRALNQWLRLGGLVSFDLSLALEMLGFFDVDVREGLRALQEKRQPRYPSAQGS